MRLLPMAALLAASALTAQSPLTTIFANNNLNAAGGMVFFDIDVTSAAGIQITSADINTPSLTGGIEFWTCPTAWLGNEANAAAWTSQGIGTFSTGAGVGVGTQVCFGNGFYLPQGQYGVAIQQDLTTQQAYTNGTGTNQAFATAEVGMTLGASNNVPFAGAPFNPRVWNGSIYYNVGPVPGTCIANAQSESYGAGCNAVFASVYEELPTAAFDLVDTDISATNTGSGYVILPTPGSGILPVGGVDPLGGTVLVLGDDNQVPAGTLGMNVGSNGWVATGAGNANAFSPTTATMLSNPAQAVYAWTDMQPNTSGTVTYEEDVATGQTRTTFDGVNGWNTVDPIYSQIDFNTITGDWVIRFGTVGFANPEQWIVGYSPAGANLDPGGTDISAAGVIVTASPEIAPLTLDGGFGPQLGGTWDLTTSAIDAVSPFAITFFGDRGPATPMPLIGINAPGCDINLASVITSVTTAQSAGSATAAVPIPNNLALAGFQFSAQSICLTLTNAGGLLSSNGAEGTVGQ